MKEQILKVLTEVHQRNKSPELALTEILDLFLNAVNDININTLAFGFELEDRNITDRYRAMEFGIEHTIEKIIETIESIY